MKEIPLTRGYVALVDDEDYEWLMQWKWNYHRVKKNIGYATRTDRSSETGKQRTVRMHTAIMGTKTGFVIDHKNHNTLDNQKSNLRFCTQGQNVCNRDSRTKRDAPRSRSFSQYKGVFQRIKPGKNKWCARIYLTGKYKYLGCFENEVDAAKVYDRAARQYFGEFADTNFEKN
jgi:HNH endonuclease